MNEVATISQYREKDWFQMATQKQKLNRQEMPILRRLEENSATRTTVVTNSVRDGKRETLMTPAAIRRREREAAKKRGEFIIFLGLMILEIIGIVGFMALRSIIELGANGLGDAMLILLKALGFSL